MLFAAFWTGVYRPRNQDTDEDALPYDFWPIYVLFGVLVLERLA